MNKMTEEKLLALVEQYPYLYDDHDKYYSDAHRKELAWKDISHKINIPAKDCKKQWSNLRDALRRFLKRKKRMTGDGVPGAKAKKWRYEDEMAFVIPYLKERPRATDMSDDSDSIDESALNPSTGDPLLEEVSNCFSQVANDPKSVPKIPDSLSAFFASMAATVNTFPPKEVIEAKMKIFEAITQMEMAILHNKQKTGDEDRNVFKIEPWG